MIRPPSRPGRAPRTYRAALYGRAGSGKTCLLAALAMPRAAHPAGSTCTRIHPDPTDGPRYPDQLRGDEWLDAAIAKLGASEPPAPNSSLEGPGTRVVRYRFTDDRVPEFRVELFDYSGEQVNPREQYDPESFVSALRARMEAADFLLVVVGTPRDEDLGVESPESPAQVRMLAEAFGEVRPRRPIPIALVATKWDRRSDLDAAAPAAESRRLAGFLDAGTAPEHTRLRDALRNAVGEPNVRAFPASAFGGHVRRAGHDHPRPGPLRSFGLEDPFVWCAARRAELDLDEFRREARAMSGLGVLRPKSWRIGRIELGDRFRAGSDERAEFDRLARRRRRLLGRSAALAAGSVVALAVAGSLIRDLGGWRTARLAGRPGAPAAEVDAAIAWLEHYSTCSLPWRWPSHLAILAPAAARAEAGAFRDRREQQAWGPVAKLAPDVLLQEGPARHYLLESEEGRHAPEANLILAEAGRARARRANEDALIKVEERIRAIPAPPDPAGLRALVTDIDALPPHADHESEDQGRRRLAAFRGVNARLAAATEAAGWDDFLKIYDGHVAAGRVADAAEILGRRRPADDKVRATAKQFLEVAPGLIAGHVKGLADDHGWPEARAFLDRCERWPLDLRPDALSRCIRAERAKVARGEDEWLYAEFQRGQRPKQADAYLDHAPLQTMRAEVRAYKDYLGRRQGKLKLELRLLEIRWDEHCWNNGYNVVTVSFDNRKAIEATGITSRAVGTTTDGFEPFKFEGTVGRRYPVEVKVVDDDYGIVGDHDHGSASASMTLDELAEGQTLKLRFEHGVNEARLRVLGMPEEPNLPAWRPVP